MGVNVSYVLRREAFKIVEGSLRVNKALKVQDVLPFCTGVQVEVSSNVFYDIPLVYADSWVNAYPNVEVSWSSGETGIVSEKQKDYITRGVTSSFKSINSMEDSDKLLRLVRSVDFINSNKLYYTGNHKQYAGVIVDVDLENECHIVRFNNSFEANIEPEGIISEKDGKLSKVDKILVSIVGGWDEFGFCTYEEKGRDRLKDTDIESFEYISECMISGWRLLPNLKLKLNGRDEDNLDLDISYRSAEECFGYKAVGSTSKTLFEDMEGILKSNYHIFDLVFMHRSKLEVCRMLDTLLSCLRYAVKYNKAKNFSDEDLSLVFLYMLQRDKKHLLPFIQGHIIAKFVSEYLESAKSNLDSGKILSWDLFFTDVLKSIREEV